MTCPRSPNMRRVPKGDDGALLVLALVFIFLMAVIVTAILSATNTSFTAATVTRQYVTKNYAADAGLRYALQQVRANPEICSGPNNLITPPANFLSSDGNNPANNQPFPGVAVTCSVDSGQPDIGANGYAIITHDPSNTGLQSGNHTLTVHGPVFMASHPGSVHMDVTNGNVYTLGTAPCPAQPNNLTVDPGHVWSCQPTVPDLPAAQLPQTSFLNQMPTRSGPVSPPPAGNCDVYLPGKYSNQTINITNSGNTPAQAYFASGVYYLDNVTIDISKGIVFAGAPHTGATYLGNTYNESSALAAAPLGFTPCSGDSFADSASGSDGSVNGTGAKFILGGSSKIVIDNPKGYLEMYSRFVPYNQPSDLATAQAAAQQEGTQGLSVMTVPVGTPAPWDAKVRTTRLSASVKEVTTEAGRISDSPCTVASTRRNA